MNDDWIDKTIEFFMKWMVGLWMTIGSMCPKWIRPIFVIISLPWIPVMFIVCLPVMLPFMFVAMIVGLWELINDYD